MYYTTRRGYLNIILLGIILAALLALVGWLAYQAGGNAAEGRFGESGLPAVILNKTDVPLTTISLAQNADLERTTGAARIGSEEGKAEVDVVLAPGASLPERSILQAWLVDAGNLGGLGEASVSEADQQYGTPYANIDFSSRVSDAPYALALGELEWNPSRESFYLFYESNFSLAPYDAVMVTLESDGNAADYDPRPGTPILIGALPK
ncbi:MAG: hypothetical protein HYT31_01890 [Parcubacteria group bacterium]|nr:hypothetical protein [Parcubacteria group bacterium]